MKKFEAHILVVDDDDGIRELVKEYLSQNNFLVSTASSADDAFEKIKLTQTDMMVIQRGVPYPIMVPSFPVLTSDSKLNYGKIFN